MDKQIDPHLLNGFKNKLNIPPLNKENEEILLRNINNNVNWLILPWINTFHLVYGSKPCFLELGCGDGKYGFFIADYVYKLIGIDIRSNSLKDANKLLIPSKSNAELILGDGRTLKEIDSKSIDIVFSFQTFTHMADLDVVINYIKEICRVLSDDGVVKIHILGPSNKNNFLRIKYFKLGRFPHECTATDNLLIKTLKRFIYCVKLIIPTDFMFPVIIMKKPANEWGALAPPLNPIKALEIVKSQGLQGMILPVSYDSNPYLGCDFDNYWLIISRDINSKYMKYCFSR